MTDDHGVALPLVCEACRSVFVIHGAVVPTFMVVRGLPVVVPYFAPAPCALPVLGQHYGPFRQARL